MVPVMARSILFEAQPGTETFFVSLNGQTIPIIPLTQASGHTLFGGDVEPFAGQSSDLQFSVYAPLFAPGGWNIDSITFSDQPVPEPKTSLLLVSGMGLLFLLRRRFTATKGRQSPGTNVGCPCFESLNRKPGEVAP